MSNVKKTYKTGVTAIQDLNLTIAKGDFVFIIGSTGSRKSTLIYADNLQIRYDNKILFSPISFEVKNKDRIAIIGKNGAGKSSILKLILGNSINYSGDFKVSENLKISYVSQSTEYLNGNLKTFVQENNVDETIFKAMLSKMGFSKEDFNNNIKEMSEGQKKKILLAKSISEQANIYVWDEPLNYIDILTRIQLEEAILKYEPTLIFVEHDKKFIENVSTKIINIENLNK